MTRPNIIILNPDEMRYTALGHSGNPAALTPNLDQFARNEAVSFSRAYCQNPVCVPSRCSFFTGLYPHTMGHRTMQYLLHEGESSLFSELKNAGYYVWMNARNDLVAGQVAGLLGRHADEIYYKQPENNGPVNLEAIKAMMSAPKKENPFPYSHFEGLRKSQGDDDWDDTRAACERILNPVRQDQPLCLFLGWNNPHPPYSAEEPYYSAIDRSKIPGRVKYEETEGKSLMIQRLHELVRMDGYTEEQWREMHAVYLAQCMKIDEMFRMVCDALKKAGIYDNSAIFFLSDHGDFCGDYGLPEKAQNTFEDCLTRVPLLIKPPVGYDCDPGSTDSLAELVDFYATVMDYSGTASDHEHFGHSLRPVIENRSACVRSFVHSEGGRLPEEDQADEWHAEGPGGPQKSNAYWPKKTAQLDPEAHEKGTMISDGHYKYVHRPSGRDELYDLSADPGERINLYGNGYTEVIRTMRMELLDWYQQTCDIVPRAYDNRFTEERLMCSVSKLITDEDMKDSVRAYIRKESPSVMQVIRHTMGLLAAKQGKRN